MLRSLSPISQVLSPKPLACEPRPERVRFPVLSLRAPRLRQHNKEFKMSRKTENPSSRRHILVYNEDWEFLEKAYGNASESRLGVGPAIRNIIHAYVNSLKAKVQRRVDKGHGTQPKGPQS